MDITQEVDPAESLVIGRNGTWKIKAVQIWGGNGMVYIDGINQRGHALRGGFMIDEASFKELVEKLKG